MTPLSNFPLNQSQAIVVLIAMALGLVAAFFIDRWFEK